MEEYKGYANYVLRDNSGKPLTFAETYEEALYYQEWHADRGRFLTIHYFPKHHEIC